MEVFSTGSRCRAVSFVILALALVFCVFAAPSLASTAKKPLAKNVIIMIGDGMGHNAVTAADYYLDGRKRTQVYERFPFHFGQSTYPYGGSYKPLKAWTDFDYVKTGVPGVTWTESDAAATALATGTKTDAGVGVNIYDEPLINIMQLAEMKGKATGVVTSVQISHATPAGFVAHNPNRSNYEAIGQEMLLTSAVDVIMGCGHPWYDNNGDPKSTPTFKYVGGSSTWDALLAGTAGGDANGDGLADPWTLVQTREEFQKLARGRTPSRVVGVAQANETLQFYRVGYELLHAPYMVPLTATVPTLEEMTRAALNVLDNDPDGLTVMIEGGAIDWACHELQTGRLIEEMADFDAAVDAVVDWVNAKSNWNETLLIVTADHETGYIWGPGSGAPRKWVPVGNNGKGVVPSLDYFSRKYSYPGLPPDIYRDHTNSLVPLWAKGNAALLFLSTIDGIDPVRGMYVDNTDVFRVMSRAIGY